MEREHKKDGFYLDFPEYDSIWRLLSDIGARYRDSVAFVYCEDRAREIEVTYGQFVEDIKNAAGIILREYE